MEANDETFQNGYLARHATKLAIECSEVLRPHLSILSTTAGNGAPESQTWVDALQEIFKGAVILKCKLDAVDESHHFTWFNAGTRLNRWKMVELHKVKTLDYEVAFTAFAGIERVLSFGDMAEMAFCRARVLLRKVDAGQDAAL